jgi:retron-type reverse transcriptase
MKRYGNLWEHVIDFDNLWLAAQKAQRGKRWRENVVAFNYNLETELFQLQDELASKSYRPGAYRTFQIVVPKKRMISAAPYRDRVVHHALCNVIAPIFERTFIADSYANRIGFGSHRALRQFTNFACSSRYLLQCDIRKYFPSIDHEQRGSSQQVISHEIHYDPASPRPTRHARHALQTVGGRIS